MTDRAEMTDSSEGNASEEAEHYAPMIEEGRTFRKLTFDAQIALQQAPGVPTKLKNERDMPYWIRTGESYDTVGGDHAPVGRGHQAVESGDRASPVARELSTAAPANATRISAGTEFIFGVGGTPVGLRVSCLYAFRLRDSSRQAGLVGF
mmetsp:Transcript_41984/g.111860  ORF Transcript_41984/g.111860 Transcript_41984/m.111860 type:complete len:150 (-) Transcript_41984:515-964(-)